MSTFKDELNKNTKTPEQLYDQRTQHIIKNAEYTYEKIKSELLSKAKYGDYKPYSSGTKHIYCEYEDNFLKEFVKCTNNVTETRKIWGRGYNISGSKTWQIDNQYEYNLYLNSIRKFASEDEIDIYPSFITTRIGHEERITLPYTAYGENTIHRYIKGYLCCSIDY